jgi:hypothetical protein
VPGLIIARMVINMDESRLRATEQLQEFVEAAPQVQFSAHGGDGDSQRYRHISAVLRRFDYPRVLQGRSRRGTGVPGAYQRLQPRATHPAGGALG